MNARLSVSLLAAFCLSAQTIDVGVGSSTLDPVITQQFVNAFFRNGFANLVSTPPLGLVRSFGTTGLVQEFSDAAKTSGVKLALVKPNTSTASVEGTPDVLQVLALMYAYYSTVGPGTAGFPTMDTAGCPNSPIGSCYWQAFSKSYALFAYSSLVNGSSTFATKDVYYTEWNANGGIVTYGPATSAETAVTSPAGSAATVQSFQNGIILNITSGTLSGRLLSVRNTVYTVYAANGGPTGFLGLPTGPEVIVGTKRRQSFEGGAIEYEPGQGGTLRLPVTNVNLSTAVTTLRLKLNETFTLEAIPRAATGDPLLDRVVSWVTTNGRVVSIQANGRTAVLKAVGGGVATITAVSEGKISAGIAIFVQAPCCQVGEGAPSAASAQAFADAVARNRLTLQLPGPSPVRRVANGYQQEFQTTAGARLVLALPDRAAQAWVLTGTLLSAYEQANGAAGVLGYPSGDPTSAGRQLFDGGALAGSPVQLVSGGILSRWALLNYETGAVGPPSGPAGAFATFAASSGVLQAFRDGLIVQISGRTLLVSGVILARYQALGLAAGKLGAPTNEEFTSSGVRRQDFEGGYMTYAPGSDVVNVVESVRKPAISVLPSSAVAGSRIRLAAGGFPDNSTLRVSTTGLPDFIVRATNGSYAWDAWIPADSPSRTVTVRAVVTTASTTAAEATYSVRSAAESRPKLTKVRGDAQSGAPGTRLPIPLRVNLKDESGSPLVGVTVTYAASPGAEISPRSTSTDINGDAEAVLRLPSGSGIALATAEASRQVVTFSAQVTGTAVSNFPKISFDGNSYVGSAAAILKYFQDKGDLQNAAGTVTAASVDSYLRNFCTLDSQANQICDGYLSNPEVANLWRLINFAGGGLEIIPVAAVELGIREALAGGSPVLISLRLTDGTAAAVVATGVNADGSIQIMDPNPRQPRTGLADYLAAKAEIKGALRFVPRAAAAGGFLLTAYGTSTSVSSPAGTCGPAFGVPGADATTLFVYCDGTQAVYQAEIAATNAYRGSLTDLAAGGPRFELNGLRSGSFRVSRPSLTWELATLEATFSATSVLNAASFAPDFAPGTAISIFGLGLARAQNETTVEIGGRSAAVIFATPFQVNAVIPLDLPSGSWPLRLTSPFGSSEAQVEVRDASPAIFRLSDSQAAVTNQDGSLNAPNNPAPRGQVIVLYGTGFGAVQAAQGSLRRTVQAVTVRGAGVDLPVVYAGLTPGSIGLYQLNVQLPSDMPPGLFQALEIREGGVAANAIAVAIR
ncbi:MAG: hypothetical protein HYX27_16540 [Acidobacteria bacterium]|nr:hypothetical protein [Acidobacteriota bacterium]